MPKGKDQNYVSVIAWMLFLFLALLPCLGFPIVLILAFVGENETRKNFFKAVLGWHIVFVLLNLALLTLGFWPVIQKFFEDVIRAFQGR